MRPKCIAICHAECVRLFSTISTHTNVEMETICMWPCRKYANDRQKLNKFAAWKTMKTSKIELMRSNYRCSQHRCGNIYSFSLFFFFSLWISNQHMMALECIKTIVVAVVVHCTPPNTIPMQFLIKIQFWVFRFSNFIFASVTAYAKRNMHVHTSSIWLCKNFIWNLLDIKIKQVTSAMRKRKNTEKNSDEWPKLNEICKWIYFPFVACLFFLHFVCLVLALFA